MRFDTKEIKIHLEGLIKYATLEATNLFQVELHLRKVLSNIPCDLEHAGDLNHAYIVIEDDEWKRMTGKEVNNVWQDGELVVKPTHPGKYIASTIASSGIYEQRLQEFKKHYAVRRATIDFIHETYKDSAVLLDLEDDNENINEDPVTIIDHLWEQIPESEKQREINKLEKKLSVEYNPNEPVQRYFKTMQTTRTHLIMLNADPLTPKMIREAVCQFEQHPELEKLTDKWQDKPDTTRQDWDELKQHYTKGIRKIANNPATKKLIGYANMAQ